MKAISNIFHSIIERSDSSLWYAFVASLFFYFAGFLQFQYYFEFLDVPVRWFNQFVFLIILSGVCSLIQFVFNKRRFAVYFCFAARVFIFFIITYPMANYISLRISLLTSLVLELMLYIESPMNWIDSIILIGMSIFFQPSGSVWDKTIEGIKPDSQFFLLLFPLTVIFLVGSLKKIQQKAARQNRLLELTNISTLNLLNTNLQLQDYIVSVEDRMKNLERERISRDLHDTIGYTLMNIIVLLKASIEISESDTTTVHNLMTQGIEQAQKGLSDTRAVLRDLRSKKIGPPSLDLAIKRLVDAFEGTSIKISAHNRNLPQTLGDGIDSTIFRMVQEGIANAIRHGNATKIIIHLSEDNNIVIVSIRDNGTGIKDYVDGIGFSGIRERLFALDGELTINNSPTGCILYARIPLISAG